MGAFLTNVHVHGQAQPEQTREVILQTLREWLSGQGLVETGEGEDADRCIAVGVSAGWIAVYDEATEEQREEDLYALAALLSAAVRGTAVSILVHDSSVLQLGLFEAGSPVARYDSNPEFSGRKKARVSVAAWKRLLVEGFSVGELQAELRSKDVFAEATLARIALLFGMDPARATIGYRHSRESPTGLATLRFRSRIRPAQPLERTGEPQFRWPNGRNEREHFVGDRLELTAGLVNCGGAVKGLQVVAAGEALTNQVVALRSARLLVGTADRSVQGPVAPLLPRSGKDGATLWVASFPEVEVPAASDLDLSMTSGLDLRKQQERMRRCGVLISVSGEVLAPGKSSFQLGLLPQATAVSEPVGMTLRISAQVRGRRPLRALQGERADAALRSLDDKRILCGLASCTADVVHAAKVAAGLIERWGGCLPTDGVYALESAGPVRGSSRLAPLRATDVFQGADWRNLRAHMAKLGLKGEQHTLRYGDEGDPYSRPGDGFAFGRHVPLLYESSKGDMDLPTLALWMSVPGKSEPMIEAARELLRQLLDEFMSESEGVQALIGQWGFLHSLECTPYEFACGVKNCNLLRSWLTRFLRGVTADWIWLGKELLAQVDQEKLAEVATVVPVASGIRLRVRPESSLDALESVLENLLPSLSDWQSAPGLHKAW